MNNTKSEVKFFHHLNTLSSFILKFSWLKHDPNTTYLFITQCANKSMIEQNMLNNKYDSFAHCLIVQA